MSNLDALLTRRGELLDHLEDLNQQIGALHGQGVKLCIVCARTISAERVQAQPRAVTCSNRECGREHQRRLNRVTAQRQRDRAMSAASGAGSHEAETVLR